MLMQSYRIDSGETKNIKELLKKLNINANRITIDLKQGTLEVEAGQQDNSDLINLCGTISRKRAGELIEHVNEARKEWDYDR